MLFGKKFKLSREEPLEQEHELLSRCSVLNNLTIGQFPKILD